MSYPNPIITGSFRSISDISERCGRPITTHELMLTSPYHHRRRHHSFIPARAHALLLSLSIVSVSLVSSLLLQNKSMASSENTHHHNDHDHDHHHHHHHDHEHGHGDAGATSWVGPDGKVYHSHDGLAPHSHDPIYSPGFFSKRAPPLHSRDFNERAFTVGIGGPVGTGYSFHLLYFSENP
ncbi:hypothetical protein CRG98_005225 [Punica granatum]|uniref:Uncharacterized protein n=1 Tax=Punica granatum TaxID=22663 RepID=A0A2I0L0U8_PUNGR|nr:hypothetical protein CRG98_005225 [Punica granatum]